MNRHHKMMRHAIYWILGCFFLSGICRVIVSEDSDGNRRIDIKDAVLHVQRAHSENMGLGQKAAKLKTAASALAVVAEIKEISAGGIDTGAFAFADASFLICETGLLAPLIPMGEVDASVLLWKSIDLPPPVIPPIPAG